MHVDYLLIGGGTSCGYAAASLRTVDSKGSVAIVSPELRLPYDRPPLSKDFQINLEMKEDDPESKQPTFYGDNQIQLVQGVMVDDISLANKTAKLSDQREIQFGKALIATGSTPRKLTIEGGNLDRVLTLRSMDDAVKIRNLASQSKSAIVIGSGYVGLEIAASLVTRGLQVTIITLDSYPWKSLVSQAVGNWIASQLEVKNIQIVFNTLPEKIEKRGEQLIVHSSNGGNYSTDFVVAGIGAEPNLDLAANAGLTIEKKGVKVNQYLQSSHPDIFTSGDISLFEDPVAKRYWRAEHHLNAQWQAETAGKNLAGTNEPYNQVAYFFSDVLDIHMAYRGCPLDSKPSRLIGEPGKGTFVELWENENGILSAGTIISDDYTALDPISDKLEIIIREMKPIQGVQRQDLGM